MSLFTLKVLSGALSIVMATTSASQEAIREEQTFQDTMDHAYHALSISDWSNAQLLYEAALTQAVNSPHLQRYIPSVLGPLMKALVNQDKFAEADRDCDEALAVLKARRAAEGLLSAAYFEKGKVHARTSQLNVAEPVLRETLKHAERSRFSEVDYRDLFGLLYVCAVNGNELSDAERFCRTLMRMRNRQSQPEDVDFANLLIMLGRVNMSQKKLDDAANSFARAVAIYDRRSQESESKRYVGLLNEYSEALRALGRMDEAVRIQKRAAVIATGAKNH